MTILSWTYLIVGLTFTLYIGIAIFTRVKSTSGFYIAGRGIPAAINGMATGADWMSAASFISMAGLISFMGYTGAVYLIGWTGGYVLLALLLAPYLRKFGKFTVPDFVGDRYYSNAARLVAVFCAIFVSFTYCAGQMRGVGVVFSRFLEVDINTGVMIGMAVVLIYATLGGMKGITYTQVAQFLVLILAYLIPAVAISYKMTGNPIPQLGLGSRIIEGENAGMYLLETIDAIHRDLGLPEYTAAFVSGKKGMLDVFAIAMALMVGTAGLPHVIIRFYTVPSVKAARYSAFWALLCIGVLYTTAPDIRPCQHDPNPSREGLSGCAGMVQKLGEDGFDQIRGPGRRRDYQLQRRSHKKRAICRSRYYGPGKSRDCQAACLGGRTGCGRWAGCGALHGCRASPGHLLGHIPRSFQTRSQPGHE